MTWPMVKLGEVAPAKPAKVKVLDEDEQVIQITLDHIEADSGRLITTNYQPITEAGSSTHWFNTEHVLYSKLRPYLNKVIVPEETGLCTTELVPMKPDPERLDRNYLAYYLRSRFFVDWVSAQTAGAKMPRVSMKVFWEHEIPLPPLAEQQRIAAILNKADAIRGKRQQAIELAEDFLRAVFLDMFGDPVTNPKGWEVCRYEDLTNLVTYGLTVRPQYHEDGVPLISAREIRTGELDFESCPRISKLDFDKLSDKGRPKKNDILFSKTGSIGHCAIVRTGMEFAVTQNAARIVPNTDVCDPTFLLAFMRTKYFYDMANREAKGNAVKDLQLGIMKDFPMYLPPMLLQKKFVELYFKAKSLIEKVDSGSVLLHSNFNGLNQKAFRGEL